MITHANLYEVVVNGKVCQVTDTDYVNDYVCYDIDEIMSLHCPGQGIVSMVTYTGLRITPNIYDYSGEDEDYYMLTLHRDGTVVFDCVDHHIVTKYNGVNSSDIYFELLKFLNVHKYTESHDDQVRDVMRDIYRVAVRRYLSENIVYIAPIYSVNVLSVVDVNVIYRDTTKEYDFINEPNVVSEVNGNIMLLNNYHDSVEHYEKCYELPLPPLTVIDDSVDSELFLVAHDTAQFNAIVMPKLCYDNATIVDDGYLVNPVVIDPGVKCIMFNTSRINDVMFDSAVSALRSRMQVLGLRFYRGNIAVGYLLLQLGYNESIFNNIRDIMEMKFAHGTVEFNSILRYVVLYVSVKLHVYNDNDMIKHVTYTNDDVIGFDYYDGSGYCYLLLINWRYHNVIRATHSPVISLRSLFNIVMLYGYSEGLYVLYRCVDFNGRTCYHVDYYGNSVNNFSSVKILVISTSAVIVNYLRVYGRLCGGIGFITNDTDHTVISGALNVGFYRDVVDYSYVKLFPCRHHSKIVRKYEKIVDIKTLVKIIDEYDVLRGMNVDFYIIYDGIHDKYWYMIDDAHSKGYIRRNYTSWFINRYEVHCFTMSPFNVINVIGYIEHMRICKMQCDQCLGMIDYYLCGIIYYIRREFKNEYLLRVC